MFGGLKPDEVKELIEQWYKSRGHDFLSRIQSELKANIQADWAFADAGMRGRFEEMREKLTLEIHQFLSKVDNSLISAERTIQGTSQAMKSVEQILTVLEKGDADRSRLIQEMMRPLMEMVNAQTEALEGIAGAMNKMTELAEEQKSANLTATSLLSKLNAKLSLAFPEPMIGGESVIDGVALFGSVDPEPGAEVEKPKKKPAKKKTAKKVVKGSHYGF